MVGVVHKGINPSSPSGIIHGHLIVLIRHKQAKMCLQSNPIHYEQISTKILKYFILANFLLPHSLTQSLTHSLTHSLTCSLTHSLIHSLTHSLMRSVKRSGKLATATATASFLWWKCLEFCSKKTFQNVKCLRVCTVLLQLV